MTDLLAGSHFAAITAGFERLRDIGGTTLWRGAQPIRFET